MLGSIKRWFSGGSGTVGWSQVADWATAAGHSFKRTRERDGFVVDSAPAEAWRLEWGPSQRSYISGPELRIRGDLQGGQDLQMLIVSRSLMESLEKQVFEQFTEGLQTRIDTDTPEEMRWLVLYPKPPQMEPRELREAFGAVGSVPQALSLWLSPALSAQLLQAHRSWLPADQALALVVQRGRLTLRHAMPRLDAERLAAVTTLYQTALQEARRVAELWGNAGGASTQPSAWSGSVVDPGEPTTGR